MAKEQILRFEKMLNEEMKGLIGTRNWNVWKNDIEPEMYNCILQSLYNYGKNRWEEAQRDAANKAKELKFKSKVNGFPICVTPFRP